MLVLSRAKGQGLVIHGNIFVEVVSISSDKVRLGIQCPPDVPVHRREIWEAIQRDISATAPAERDE